MSLNHICLKWNSYLSNIASSFETLWQEEGLVDVTLASDGQCLLAHKIILSACSPFFKKLFQTNPCQHPVIILQDVHFEELQALLNFIYRGEVNIEQEQLPALLRAAETLQIRGLSGGDSLTQESYKQLASFNKSVTQEHLQPNVREEKQFVTKKKQKLSKNSSSLLEKALVTHEPDGNETMVAETCPESDLSNVTEMTNSYNQHIPMKVEPFEVNMQDLQNNTPIEAEILDQLDPDQQTDSASTTKHTVTVIPETNNVAMKNDKRKNISPRDDFHNSPYFQEQCPPIPQSSSGMSKRNSEIFGFSSHGLLPVQKPKNALFEELGSKDNSTFPCPLCDRVYNGWGYRRRHVKACHNVTSNFKCKLCPKILNNTEEWKFHLESVHNFTSTHAQKSALILEEAHTVFQTVVDS